MDRAFRQVTASANKKTAGSKPAKATKAKSPKSGPKKAPASPKKKGKIIAIVLGCVLILGALGAGGLYVYDKTSDDGLILDNVYAAGIDLTDMSKEEASDALHAATDDTYTKENLTVRLPDCKLILTPEQTKANLDVDKLVEDAWNYGRDGNVFDRARARANAALTEHRIELADYLNLDESYIRELVDQFAQEVSSTLSQPEVQVTGNRDDAQGQVMTVTMGTADRSIDADSLYGAILEALENNDFTPIDIEYTETLPQKPDIQAVYEQYCTPAKNAELDPETFEVTPEVSGYGFDLEAVQKQVDEAKEGDVIKVTFKDLEAEVTAKSLEDNLFVDVLGECKTPHTNIPDRTNNLILACEAINGYIVKPGEIFSFNEVVGERTDEKGYRPALIYSGGLSVPAPGGGICQVASTIYCCCLYADLEVVERACHQFVADYVPQIGMDATIFWGSYDYKFRNNTDYPIRIEAYVENGYVYVTLWGKDTKDYTVEITTEIVATTPWSVEEKEIREGSADWGKYSDGEVIVTPYTGYKVETYKTRIDKETGERTTEWEAESRFDSRNKLVAKLVPKEEEPTEPPETDPPETPAPETDPPETDPPETDPPEVPAPEAEPPAAEPQPPAETPEPGM